MAKDDKNSSDQERRRKASPAERKRKRKLLWTGGLIIVACLIAACVGLRVWHKPFYVTGVGYVTTASRAEVRAMSSGPVERILVKDGDRVAKGQVLITLSDHVQQTNVELARANLAGAEAELSFDENGAAQLTGAVEASAVARAQAELTHYRALLEHRTLAVERIKTENVEAAKRAKAELDAARDQFERMENLSDRDLTSAEEFERAKLVLRLKESLYEVQKNTRGEELAAELAVLAGQIELAQWNVASAEASYAAALVGAEQRLIEARAASRIAEANYAAREIRSPIDGVLSLRNIEIGESVSSSEPVGEVFDNSTFVVRAKISEQYLHRVEAGQPVSVVFDAYPPHLFGSFGGTVTKLSGVVTPQQTVGEGYFLVHVELDPIEQTLRPGLSANLSIQAGTVSGLRWLTGRD